MKIFIFSLTLALSLCLTGWLFASYRQNQEQLQQTGQKTAALEKEKSSLEEELKKYQSPLKNSVPQEMTSLEKQEYSLNRQITEQKWDMEEIQRLVRESERQIHSLKVKEEDRKSLLRALSIKREKEAAAIVPAPQSIAGATITIEYRVEGKNKVFKQTLSPNDYFMGPEAYVPKGNTASITFEFSEQYTATKLMNWFITSVRTFEEMVKSSDTPPAVITFTGKKGNTYTGTIKGYAVNDRMQRLEGLRLVNITITLPQ